MSLDDYRRKRDFKKSPEPRGQVAPSPTGRLYVIQKHAARSLHYDLRLELDGVLKSWAVPKGPSLDPGEKRLAVEVEDHPIDYGGFEGIIPENAYGAGTVLVWDYGEWEPEEDPHETYEKGRLKFRLRGQKLKGSWALARMKVNPRSGKPQWLLIKHRDSEAVPGDADGIVARRPESVLSGRSIEQVAEDKDLIWKDGEAVPPAPAAGRVRGPRGLPFDPAVLPGARKAEFPATFRPQKAVPVESPPEGDDWLHEIKYDGYRLLCVIQDRRVALVTRSGNDWTDRFPQITYEAAALPAENAILDGEVVVQRKDGTTDFQALQNYLKGRKQGTLAYFVFDLPYLEGYDLSAVPLQRRKQALKELLQPGKHALMRFGGQIVGQGQAVLRRACELGIEGIVSKKTAAPYQQERSALWVKSKCRLKQEFVIGGYSSSAAAPAGLRSLLLGFYNPAGKLIYAGRVGTGFSDLQREELRKLLQERARKTSAFANPPRGRDLHWAAPELVAEVVFAEWTTEGILRHASFKGLREDKPALQVVLETPQEVKSASRPQSPSLDERTDTALAGLRLSHPHRILFPERGITKKALATYYQLVAGRMLPYLIGRPLTLVRCPEGHTGECFYQKHINQMLPEGLKGVRIREENEEQTYIYIVDQAGLLSLVQISALEIHPWGSRVDDPDTPDTLIFDLDPDPGLSWEHVIHAAWHLKGILQGMGLVSFVKTSGGKGLHVQLPIKRKPAWEALKQFARNIATHMARAHPARYTINPRKSSRKGKIFVDYLRNARGATSVAPYSTRARAGAPLSVPVAWEALSADLRPDTFTLQNLPAHLEQSGKDPWADYFRVENEIPQ